MRRDLTVCLTLLALTAVAYASVYRHEFLFYDDTAYVTANEHVQDGLTWSGIAWAFTTTYAANWHPLAWLSHMLDWQLFGNWAGGHHLTSLALHLLNTLLLFWVLRRMTGAVWRSAMVAGLFALHPLHVESVAWVAERKDVLCAAFGLLTLWAYSRYVERPGAVRYAAVVVLYFLGLLSKPMLVTLPFVLLLLDYWPLGRFSVKPRPMAVPRDTKPQPTVAARKKKPPSPSPAHVAPSGRSISWLFIEKTPLFVLTVASCVVTFYAQKVGGAVVPVERLTLPVRIGNALTAYVDYLFNTFAPMHLAAFYPHSYKLDAWSVLGAGAILLAVSILALWAARRLPYAMVGWFWYLGMLAPVVGLVQVGSQSMADRYTYLPLIGIFIVVAWGAADAASQWTYARRALPVAAAATLIVCAALTWRQVGYWADTFTLFQHALDVTGPNHVAYNNVGLALNAQGKRDEAKRQFRLAIDLSPTYIEAHGNLGNLLADEGRLDEAVREYREVLRLAPNDRRVHCQLGMALGRQRKMAEAEACFRESLRLQYPTPAAAHNNLAIALHHDGKSEEAMEHYHEAVRLRPKMSEAWNNMAWIRATHPDHRLRNGSEAVEFAGRALENGRRSAGVLDTLAAAYAEAGSFDRAVATIREATALARKAKETKLLAQLEEREALFKSGRPYRDPTLAGPGR